MTYTGNEDESRALAAYSPPEDAYLDPVATFRAGLHSGDYDAIVGEDLRRAVRAAAAEPDLETEIGALRLALVRLLQEEYDPYRLAVGVSRLASVAVQAARVRNKPDSALDEIQRIMQRELEAIEAERALELEAHATPDPAPTG